MMKYANIKTICHQSESNTNFKGLLRIHCPILTVLQHTILFVLFGCEASCLHAASSRWCWEIVRVSGLHLLLVDHLYLPAVTTVSLRFHHTLTCNSSFNKDQGLTRQLIEKCKTH